MGKTIIMLLCQWVWSKDPCVQCVVLFIIREYVMLLGRRRQRMDGGNAERLAFEPFLWDDGGFCSAFFSMVSMVIITDGW